MENQKLYYYVGPSELLGRAVGTVMRRQVDHKTDISAWVKQTGQAIDKASEIVATFIIDAAGKLWIADRHSEHVACADGGPVLSAGEMTFRFTKGCVEASAVTNQSTGFCPEPKSWPVVGRALDEISLPHPGDFTTSFDFRLCQHCCTTNIVKDNNFVCGVCSTELDPMWNFNPLRTVQQWDRS